MKRKTVLITGCSSGIGYDCAKALAKEYKVIATARKDEDVAKLKKEGFEAYRLDVIKSEEIDKVLDVVLKNHKTLYALFNNAGYGLPGAVEDITKEALREQFETNFFGMWELTAKAVKIFRAQGYGRIINHSSILGLVSLRFRGAYNASKYAIEGMDDTLRLELAGTDIFVSTINTVPVRSKFRENAIRMFLHRVDYKHSFFYKEYKAEMLEAKESSTAAFSRTSDVVIANIRHALSAKKPRARYYNTEATWVLAFLKRLLPTSWLDRVLTKI